MPDTLVDVFDRFACELPAQPAVSGTSREGAQLPAATWAELCRLSEEVAAQVRGALGAAAVVAVLVPRSPLWVATTIAVLRCKLPFVWMGPGDLPHKSRHVEAARNTDILRSLSPGLVLQSPDVPKEVVPDWSSTPHPPVVVTVLVDTPPVAGPTCGPPAEAPRPRDSSSNTLCYMLTGGTTGKSKVVEVSQQMALHEVASYPAVAPSLGSQDRVLQHTPVLWAASALGQWDIALAFGAAMCISASADQEVVLALGASVLGLVPSALEALDPQAAARCVRCVFTWGEPLSRVLAQRWRGRGIPVHELLISTEYWLSFVGDGQTSEAGAALYFAVPGVDFAVLPGEPGQPVAKAGAVGELCLRGPMVTVGYMGAAEAHSACFVAAADGGAPFFRTSDRVKLVEDGARGLRLEFRGRSDQLVKVAGQFVDLAVAQERLESALQGSASAVAILPARAGQDGETNTSGPAAHAFIAPADPDCGAADASMLLARARAELPRGAALHVVSAPLPKHPTSGKVDGAALLAGLRRELPRFPAGPGLRARIRHFPRWWLFLLLAGVVDLPSLGAGTAASMASGGLVKRLCLAGLLHGASMPYIWLTTLHLPRGLLRKAINHVPFGRVGIVCLLHHLARRAGRKRLPAGVGRAAQAALASSTVAGIALAHSGQRLLAWWVAFWLAAPDQVESESGWWLQRSSWRWYGKQLCSTLLDVPMQCWRLADGTSWALSQLPGLLKQWQARRQLPPRRPALPLALREDVAAPCSCASRGSPKISSGEEGCVVPEAATSAGLAPVSHPEWEAIWASCAEDTGKVAGTITIGSDDLTAETEEAGHADQAALPSCTPVSLLFDELGAPLESYAAAHAPVEAEPGDSSLKHVGHDGDPWRDRDPWIQASVECQEEPAAVVQQAFKCLLPGEVEGIWRCCLCGLVLTSDSKEWRQEEGRHFCRSCLKEYDDDWWDHSSREVVDVRAAEGEEKEAPPPPAQQAGAAEWCTPLQATCEAGAHLLLLLEPLLGGGSSTRRSGVVDRPLVGVDSLAVLGLCRSLRLAAPGLALRPQDVFQCASVSQLLALVEERAASCAPTAAASTTASLAPQDHRAVAGERAIWFSPGQYTGTCKWLYACKGLLDEQYFRIAAARLVARHEALHTEVCAGQAGLELLRFLRDFATLHISLWPGVAAFIAGWPAWAKGPVGRLAAQLRGVAAWSLRKSWPRSKPQPITQEFLDSRLTVFHCQSWREVDEAVRRHREEFTPPFTMGLFLLDPRASNGLLGLAGNVIPGGNPEWVSPTSFVHFVVSHAYSDGYCSVPLIQDFGALYAKVEASCHCSCQGRGPALGGTESGRLAPKAASPAASVLAPLPHGAAADALQERFFAAVDGQRPWSHPDQLSLRGTGFDAPWAPKWLPWVYNHEILLESGAVASLQQSSRRYGIPFDVILLSTVLAGMFRASKVIGHGASPCGKEDEAAGGTLGPMSLPLTLYVPMRDGDLNEAMVGLFSDWRDVVVSCAERMTLIGLCLDVADMIRHRRWRIFDPIQNSEHILVNILPLDEEARGPQQFRQTRAHEYGGRRGSPGRQRRAWRSHHRPMRITLEQEAVDAWWLVFDINGDRFSTAWCRSFTRQLESVVLDLARRPLVAALSPAAPRPLASRHLRGPRADVAPQQHLGDGGQQPVLDGSWGRWAPPQDPNGGSCD